MDQSDFRSWDQPADLYPAVQGEGQTREQNSPYDQVQRTVITDRSPGSNYKVQAILRTCIHGEWTKGSGRPASLIVVDYRLVITKEGARFSSMYTEFEFSDYETNAPSSPMLRGFAPFSETTRFNFSSGEVKKTTGAELSLSPEFKGLSILNSTIRKEKETTYEQRYFDQGVGGIQHSKQVPNVVWWHMTQNRSQDNGISDSFRVAMLVERKGSGKFKGQFQITAKGGFGYIVADFMNKFVRKTATDDPVIFDPAAEPYGNDLEGPDGHVIEIDKSELGSLVKNNKLAGLVIVDGLNPLNKGD